MIDDTMKQALKDDYVAGGITAALGRNFTDGIGQAFSANPQAVMYYEGGFVGGIATGLWAPAISHGFHGYSVSLPAQLIATCAALAYAIVAGTLTFKFIGWLMDLRVAPQEEVYGLDLSEHGASAYPELESRAVQPLHVLSGIRVAEVMTQPPRVSLTDSVAEIEELMLRTEIFSLPVLDEAERLCGIVSISDIASVHPQHREHTAVKAICTLQPESAFPDQTVHEVVERMRDRRLANFPVVSRKNQHALLGLVTKADIVQAYRRVTVESATAIH